MRSASIGSVVLVFAFLLGMQQDMQARKNAFVLLRPDVSTKSTYHLTQRERSMSPLTLVHGQMCRREWKRIDIDFNYKWPVLSFYIDQSPENRPLTLQYVRRLRGQLGLLMYECHTHKGALKNIIQVDVQLANMERLLEGKAPISAYTTRANDGAGFLLLYIGV